MALNTRSLKSGKHSYILKQLWLSVNADGLLGGFTAVSAKLKLDPTIISAGIKFRFD
jgi:outer membrane protein W